MAITNRSKDPSEQRVVLQVSNAATATGVTLNLGIVPWPCVIEAGQMAAWGLSGAPGYSVAVNRFIAGTGFTTIVLVNGASNLAAELGTSGVGAFGASIFGASGIYFTNAAGSTLLQLLANDLLTVTSTGSNAAAKAVSVAVVLKPSQDLKVHFGID